MRKGLLILLWGTVSLFSADHAFYRSIVLATCSSLPECSLYAKQVGSNIQKDPNLLRIQKAKGFSVLSRPSGRYYIAAIEPLYDDNTTLMLFEFAKKFFHDAFIYQHKGAYKTARSPFYIYQPAVNRDSHKKSKPAVQAKPAPQTRPHPQISKEEDSRLNLYIPIALAALLILVWLLRRRRSFDKGKPHAQMEELLVGVGKQIHAPAKEIIQSSEKILQTPLSPEQIQEIEKIRHSDIRVLNVATELIEYMRIKADEITIRQERFYLDNVLDEVAGNVAHAFRGEGIRLIYDIEKKVPSRLKGDPDNLGKIIRKLIESAIRRSGKGDVKLIIRVDGTEKKPIISYSVIDAAVPLSKHEIERIFEPFCVDDRGSGLSLFIAQSIAKRMGGWIEAKNNPDRGNRFTAVLPFSPVDEDRRFYPLPAKGYTGRSVLIVDPHTPSAEAIQHLFEYFKNRVTLAGPDETKASEAWLRYDLILVAPEALNEESVAFLKTHKTSLQGKLVLVVDMLMPHPKAQAYRPLFDAQIAKPLDRQRIYDLIVDLWKDKVPQERKEVRIQTQPTTKEEIPAEVEEAPNITKESFCIFKGASLLIVEDNKINQKVLISLLSTSGIRIVIAEDGKEALQKLESEGPFDLVLMDINMPVMDGYEATRHIRMQEKYADLPVVSLTGLGLPEEIAKMYAIGMNRHLLKPLKVGQLYTIFKEFLPYSQTEASAQSQPDQPESNDLVDFQKGIALANHERTLYAEVLSEFAKLYETLPERSLNPADTKTLYKTAIDLKGVAANLGAFRLADSADKIVTDIRDGKKVTEETITQLQTVLKKTLQTIHAFLQKEQGTCVSAA